MFKGLGFQNSFKLLGTFLPAFLMSVYAFWGLTQLRAENQDLQTTQYRNIDEVPQGELLTLSGNVSKENQTLSSQNLLYPFPLRLVQSHFKGDSFPVTALNKSDESQNLKQFLEDSVYGCLEVYRYDGERYYWETERYFVPEILLLQIEGRERNVRLKLPEKCPAGKNLRLEFGDQERGESEMRFNTYQQGQIMSLVGRVTQTGANVEIEVVDHFSGSVGEWIQFKQSNFVFYAILLCFAFVLCLYGAYIFFKIKREASAQ